MKKVFAFAAVAALVVLSCNKAPDPVAETLSVSPTSVTLEGEGESAKLAVETNAASVTAQSSETWLSVTVSGKEITITAEANPTEEPRTAVVTVKGSSKTFSVNVTQKKGSRYPGYTAATTDGMDYSGILMMKMTGMTEYEGGEAQLRLTTEDGRYSLLLDFFIDCFASAEEVTLTIGTYSKGNDNVTEEGMKLEGKAKTYFPGVLYVISDEEGDEELQYGTFLTTTIGENSTVDQITGGTFSVEEVEGGYLIKTDLKTAAGDDVKLYYEGPVTINADGAVYPGEAAHGDPTKNIESASITYNGAEEEGAPVNLLLTLSCEGGYPMTTFSFYVPSMTYDELLAYDLSGNFYPADGETTAAGDAGTVDMGSSMDLGGFVLPMGSYVIYAPMDYFIPDGFVSLTLTKTADKTYQISGALMDAAGTNMYMFMGEESFEFSYTDGTAYEDEEE